MSKLGKLWILIVAAGLLNAAASAGTVGGTVVNEVGNPNFGGTARFKALATTSSSTAKIELGVLHWAKALGWDLGVVDVAAAASCKSGGKPSSMGRVKLGAETIYSKTANGGLSFSQKPARSFTERKMTYLVGPVSVQLSAIASSNVYANASLQAGASSVREVSDISTSASINYGCSASAVFFGSGTAKSELFKVVGGRLWSNRNQNANSGNSASFSRSGGSLRGYGLDLQTIDSSGYLAIWARAFNGDLHSNTIGQWDRAGESWTMFPRRP